MMHNNANERTRCLHGFRLMNRFEFSPDLTAIVTTCSSCTSRQPFVARQAPNRKDNGRGRLLPDVCGVVQSLDPLPALQRRDWELFVIVLPAK